MAAMKRESVVAQRVAEFVGRPVAMRLTWAPDAEVVGVLLGVAPLGRDYFLELTVAGRKRMIATRALLELGEVVS